MSRRTPEIILQSPVISEKSYASMPQQKYMFHCPLWANKVEIAEAVERLFSVVVVAVNTLRVRGKEHVRSRGGRRVSGRSTTWKKAIVTLAPGHKIEDLFQGV